ncbi:hypothetical protein ACOMHN_012629 [Nucella lapillus]
MDKPQQANSKVGVTHLLQGMNEPVSALLTTSSSPSASGDLPGKVLIRKSEEVVLNADIQERLAMQLAIRHGRLVATSSPGTSVAAPAVSDVSMGNVLTALASQHVKASVKQEDSESLGYISMVPPPSYTNTATTTTTVTREVVLQPSTAESSFGRPQPQIIIYYGGDQGVVSSSSSSSGNSAIVGDLARSVAQDSAGQNYHTVVLQPAAMPGAVAVSEPSLQSVISEASAAAANSLFSDSSGTFVTADVMNNETERVLPSMSDALCPVCGDKISGYHYGVYTCESCKGFFKRTVQNKKAFTCHKQNMCEVGLQNRKKCPACRFTKCISQGMKLEAIRQDRTRGGRSSYNGSLPLVKPKPAPIAKKMKRVSTDSGSEDSRAAAAVVAPAAVPNLELKAVEEAGRTHGQLAAILNHSTDPKQQGVPVPELLTDIMNLENLLVDDDMGVEVGEEGGVMNEQAFFEYLMRLTEVRLYKLVRWARNLPQFGSITTDDQILLLQNCWSDLLALGVCWRSVGSNQMLHISATHSLSLEQAQALGFGDVIDRLLSIAQSLERLGVDQIEYVALKVLLLISPDVKGLKEPGKVQDYQEKLSEALMTYTGSHYSPLPSKFGEMLLRLPELARISFLAKEILLGDLHPSLANCGLLVELLKGENAAKD